MHSRVSTRVRRLAGVAACVGLFATTGGATASIEDLQYEGRVVVGADGNGWVAARFPTTVGGEDVAYYLDIWTRCGEESTVERDQHCPSPVKALGVTLNGEVVFRKSVVPTFERNEITLNLVGTSDNEIMVSAEGERGATAWFAVVAVPPATRQK